MTKCQRKQGARGRDWWFCHHCNQSWNERNTGPHWRPYDCYDRKDKDVGEQAYRHRNNHNGHGSERR